MPIPIVIVWGSRDSFARLGWTARKCPRCQKVQPFEAFHQTRAHHIYYITVQKEEKGTIVACDFCDSTFALEKSETPKFDAKWSRSLGLEALVRTTNPGLPVTPKTKPSDQELFALLESTNEKGSVLGKDISRPLLLGAVVSALVLGPLLAGARELGIISGLDSLGYGMLGAMVGGLVGGTVWAIVSGRRKARAIMLDALRRAMGKHRLDVATLRGALSMRPDGFGRVRKVLANL